MPSARRCDDGSPARRCSSGGGTRSETPTSSGTNSETPSLPAIMMSPWPWAKVEWRAVCAERCTYGSGRGSAYALPTPLPMAKGFVYLVAIVDWFSRKVLAWRVSITMEAVFCFDELAESLARLGTSDIFTLNQDSHLT